MAKSKKGKFNYALWKFVNPIDDLSSSEKKWIIYVRVSDQKQIIEWHWIETQKEACFREAEARGITIVDVFEDRAISWTEMDRKWLNSAIKFLEEQNKHKVNIHYFICTELSRISRNKDLLKTIQLEKKINKTWAQIIAGSTIVDDNDETGVINKDLQYMFAKWESQKISMRTVRGYRGRMQAWYWTPAVPAWYDRSKQRIDWKDASIIVIKEPEAGIIKHALQGYANWLFNNQAQVLDYLNSQNLTSNFHSPNPGKLRHSFVERLFDPIKIYFYAGYILYPSYEINEPIIAKHPALISLETAQKIFDKLWGRSKRSLPTIKNPNDFILKWSLMCPHCERPFTASKSRGKMGQYYSYYHCWNLECIGSPKPRIRIEDMHSQFEALLIEIKPKEHMFNIFDELLEEAFAEKKKLQEITDSSKQAKIKQLDQELEKTEKLMYEVSNELLLKKLEQKWQELQWAKAHLENQMNQYSLNSGKIEELGKKFLFLLKNSLELRRLKNTQITQLLTGVRFWWKIYYKKNQKLRTPDYPSWLLCSDLMQTANLSNGATDGTWTRGQWIHKPLLYQLSYGRHMCEKYIYSESHCNTNSFICTSSLLWKDLFLRLL